MPYKNIEKNGILYAEFLPADVMVDETKFFSEMNSGFQLGMMKNSGGYKELPHYHKNIRAAEISASEFIFVKSGSIIIRFYDEDGIEFENLNLITGDAIVLVNGCHSYEVNEDFMAITVKQGPFSLESNKFMVNR